MSEPNYLVLDEHEDFSMQAHVDSDGYQRVAVQGYLQKRKSDGLYQAPLIPALFFGADGSQLDTWRQYLHAGDQTILRRDGGNPSVPDHELAWRKVESYQRPASAPIPPTVVTADLTPVYVVGGLALVAFVLYLAVKK